MGKIKTTPGIQGLREFAASSSECLSGGGNCTQKDVVARVTAAAVCANPRETADTQARLRKRP